MGIDPMNNITIIIRILFVVTLFQHKTLQNTPKGLTNWYTYLIDLIRYFKPPSSPSKTRIEEGNGR
jgi:hypothetical protein